MPVELCLLGPLEVRHDGEAAPLPRSKKTRALLAYLVATGRPHSRDHLGALLWDTTDDPRGALRWSLSKLRPVLDGGSSRLVADRRQVAFDVGAGRVDALDLVSLLGTDLAGTDIDELEKLASRTRGEFLEGLELPDQFEFQAWSLGWRERARTARCELLAELVSRLSADPARALVHAHDWVGIAGVAVEAHRAVLELLLASGQPAAARRQYDLSRRLFKELGTSGAVELDGVWREVTASSATAMPAEGARDGVPVPGTRPVAYPSAGDRFVGREVERDRLVGLLSSVTADPGLRLAVVTGEPGVGKSRLASWLVGEARSSGRFAGVGRCFEAESSRPFGPWIDALGDVVSWSLDGPVGGPASREALFGAVASAVVDRARASSGGLLLIDDLQWADRDSAELLHVVARLATDAPLLLVLLARTGELDDNESVRRVVRSLRREATVATIELGPLTTGEIAMLLADFGAVDEDRVHRASSGNPLYALELARAAAEGRPDQPPASLVELVLERVDRLPSDVSELLRWCAVLGRSVDVSRVRSLSSLEPERLIEGLEQLERHALLSTVGASGQYRFAHDVVREAVYAALSLPRRRLMHQQIARRLEPGMDDAKVAAEIAHHAAVGGEASLGVRACLAAGRRSLRVFANGDAETMARRGIELAEGLAEPDMIAAKLDLFHLSYSARTPEREEAATRVHELAVRALDLGLTEAARLGFQMLSFLRWESSSMADAHTNIMQAERVSRTAEPGERAAALAQAARCLVLLERNLNQAEAFVLEAEALEDREGRSPSAVQFATAMIHAHRGEYEEAVAAFREARWRGREQGDRLAEHRAIEHWTMLEIDRGRFDEAFTLARHLADLGKRVREGAEGPTSRVLLELSRRMAGHPFDEAAFAAAQDELRALDAKYPLAFVAIRLAEVALEAGDVEQARRGGHEGLELATAIGRPSDVARSRVVLARCAENLSESSELGEHVGALRAHAEGELAADVRDRVRSVLERVDTVG